MDTNSLIIKTAGFNDIDDLLPLLEQLFAIEEDFIFNGPVQRRGLQMMLDGCGKHRVVKTAWMAGRLIGMCTAQTRISTAQGSITAVIEDLVVDREYRGRGIGEQLIRAIEAWACKLDICHLSLLADKTNTPALRFYEAGGYTTTRLICLTKRMSDKP